MSGERKAQLRRTVLHRALYRPNLLLGGERELVMFTLLISGGLVASALNLPALVVGASIWGLSVGLLRMMAQSDPYMSQVYRRSLRYAAYYPPHSTPFREH